MADSKDITPPRLPFLGEIMAITPHNLIFNLMTLLANEGVSLREAKEKSAGQIEEKMIKEAMVRAGGNKTRAARILKIDRTTLYSKIKEFQINPVRGRTPEASDSFGNLSLVE